jgi:hypothetical protein
MEPVRLEPTAAGKRWQPFETRHRWPNVSSRTAAAIIAIVLAFLAILMVRSWHHERPRETGTLGQHVPIAQSPPPPGIGEISEISEISDFLLCFPVPTSTIFSCVSIL